MEATEITSHLKVLLSIFQLKENVEKDGPVDVMHSVFQKAFDKVERLGRELNCHRIRRKVISRIKNFLKQGNRVGISSQFSQWRIICGSPERPVLKVELLNLFSNGPEKEMNN